MRIKVLLAGIFTSLTSFMLVGTADAQVPPSIERGNFYNVRNITDGTSLMDPANADPCEKLQYRIRLHNPGPTEVAENITVNVVFPSGRTDRHISSAVINGSNIFPRPVSDTATVNLSSVQRIIYDRGSSQLLDDTGTVINDDLADVVGGANVSIGNIGVSTNQLRMVQFTATVDCPPPPPPPVSEGVCSFLDLVIANAEEAEVRARVEGSVNNATITGYRLDFGDGVSVNQQEATHRYTSFGTFTITGFVTIRFADGRVETKNGPQCQAQVIVEEDKPPVVIPPKQPPVVVNKVVTKKVVKTLPATGPTEVIGAFLSVAAGGAIAYQIVSRRFGLL